MEDCFREGKIFISHSQQSSFFLSRKVIYIYFFASRKVKIVKIPITRQGSCTTNAKIQLIAAELFEFEWYNNTLVNPFIGAPDG